MSAWRRPARTISCAIQIFLRRDCIHSLHLGVMLAKRKKMETRKQPISMRAHNCAAKVFRSVAPLLLIASLLVLYARPKNKSEANQTTAAAIFDDPLALVLTPQTSDSRIDKEISQLQQRIRDGRNIELWLERLGWAFVAKARESFDPGFYKLAEQCALSIEKRDPQSQEAMLLQAHVLQNLHRFNESEGLARRVAKKKRPGSKHNFASTARAAIRARWHCFSQRGTSFRKQRFDSRERNWTRAAMFSRTTLWRGRWLQPAN